VWRELHRLFFSLKSPAEATVKFLLEPRGRYRGCFFSALPAAVLRCERPWPWPCSRAPGLGSADVTAAVVSARAALSPSLGPLGRGRWAGAVQTAAAVPPQGGCHRRAPTVLGSSRCARCPAGPTQADSAAGTPARVGVGVPREAAGPRGPVSQATGAAGVLPACAGNEIPWELEMEPDRDRCHRSR